MDNLQAPEVLALPFANNGQKNEIPVAATGTNAASLTEGFPPITMKLKEEGGRPPEGKDFNGAMYMLSSFYFAFQNGWMPTFEQEVSDAIGGYAKGAILWYTANESRQALQSQKNNNTDDFNANPDYIGVSWKAVFPDLQTIQESIPISLQVGDLLPNIGNVPPAGRMVCNGARIANCQTLYPEFYNFVLQKTPYKTEAQFNEQVSQYGQCGYCAVDGPHVTLPLITRPISGVTTLAQTGMAVNDTLRAIKGYFNWDYIGDPRSKGRFNGPFYPTNNAPAEGRHIYIGASGSDEWNPADVGFDTSRLGPQFNGSETRGKQVLYPYSVVVYNTIPDKATVDVAELVSLVKNQNQADLRPLPATTGNIMLENGGIYYGTISQTAKFVLPSVSQALFSQIFIQLRVEAPNGVKPAVDWGTDYQFDTDLSNDAGDYNIIYEYDYNARKWTIGQLPKKTIGA